MQEDTHIVILGAGLVGSLLSIYLAQRGFKVSVYEKRPDMRAARLDGGRSINLALSNRGWLALKEVGLEEEVKKLVIPMKGRMMHDIEGALTFQPYGKEDQAINSISRSGLNTLLMDTAEKKGVEFFFQHPCLATSLKKQKLTIKNLATSEVTKIPYDFVIGADGAFSSLRSTLRKTERFNYSQYYLDHGYKELTIPPTSKGDYALEQNALHIWPRNQFMLIALPNKDKSFTCTLFLGFEGNPSFELLETQPQVSKFFHTYFPDVISLMPTLVKDFSDNPTSSLVTIRCSPWAKGKALLIGDASHAIVPFYGQGMNAGFEDCHVFNQLLDQHENDWPQLFAQFQELRIPDANAIADLAFQNFIEMRDRVADPQFLLRKKIEAKLHELYPDSWIPLYSMVTFSDLRYSEAMAIGRRQEWIMDQVMDQPEIEKTWEHLDFQEIVGQLV